MHINHCISQFFDGLILQNSHFKFEHFGHENKDYVSGKKIERHRMIHMQQSKKEERRKEEKKIIIIRKRRDKRSGERREETTMLSIQPTQIRKTYLHKNIENQIIVLCSTVNIVLHFKWYSELVFLLIGCTL